LAKLAVLMPIEGGRGIKKETRRGGRKNMEIEVKRGLETLMA